MILILDNIRSAHNVGSLFRTADAVGVSDIFLCGVTPDPVDRFGRDRSDVAKIALGAEKSVRWVHFESTKKAVEHVLKEGCTVVALEQSDKSEDYSLIAKKVLSEKVALVVGEETQGLSTEILDLVDCVAEIPMYGEKESLNVSVAAGIMLYALRS